MFTYIRNISVSDICPFLFCTFGNQIKALHLYDCLRANKSTSAWGIEARVPFLDREFINIAMGIDPESKMVRIYSGFSLQFLYDLIQRKASANRDLKAWCSMTI